MRHRQASGLRDAPSPLADRHPGTWRELVVVSHAALSHRLPVICAQGDGPQELGVEPDSWNRQLVEVGTHSSGLAAGQGKVGVHAGGCGELAYSALDDGVQPVVDAELFRGARRRPRRDHLQLLQRPGNAEYEAGHQVATGSSTSPIPLNRPALRRLVGDQSGEGQGGQLPVAVADVDLGDDERVRHLVATNDSGQLQPVQQDRRVADEPY